MRVIQRQLRSTAEFSLDGFRVTVIHGARQSGKTTLVRQIISDRDGTYVTLDDEATRQAALGDPRTFLQQHRYPLAIDEVQLGGDRLIRAVKQLVDESPDRGRFLLTGSTNFLTVPTLSESLAGRVHILRLWPLSQTELTDGQPAVESWFEQSNPPTPKELPERGDYLELACAGGYPEIVDQPTKLREAWFRSYIETVTQRDIGSLSEIRKVTELPRLLNWAASMSGGELNTASTAQALNLNRSTITTYVEWLEIVFLIHRISGWSRNFTARAKRRPKIHLTDTGLLCNQLGVDSSALASATSPATGPVVESYVTNEIAKQLSTIHTDISLFHLRDDRREVDLLLERRDGAIVALEIKASQSPSADNLGHVAWLRDKIDKAAPGQFKAGILLHTGKQSLTVGDRLHLRPISSLWS